MESVHVMLCITFCLEQFWFREALFQGAGTVGAVVYRFFVTIVTGNGTLFMQIHSTLNLVCIQSCDTGSQSGLARPRRLSGAARDGEVGQNGIQSNINTDTIHTYLTTVSIYLNMVHVQNVKVHKQDQRQLNVNTGLGIIFPV